MEREPHNNIIERLQSSPDHVKRRWVLWGTVIVMLLLLIVWLMNMNTFLELDPPQRANETTKTP